ncbi:MAG: hypothetical protein MR016_00670 [Agathobacter sp.]|nr:hypothetical protein [Agathobacter sp.]
MKNSDIFSGEGLQKQTEIVSLDMALLKEKVYERVAEIACWNQMEEEMAKQQRKIAYACIQKIWEEYDHTYCMHILLRPFSVECIRDGFFLFGKDKVVCDVLKKVDRKQISGGYLYALRVPETKAAYENPQSLLQQYYIEAFQVACMDVTRAWIRKHLQQRHSGELPCVCSRSFGPGFYGMKLEDVPVLLDALDAQQIEVTWDKGCMHPQMSLTGIYLLSSLGLLPQGRDCRNCIGGGEGCNFCCDGNDCNNV